MNKPKTRRQQQQQQQEAAEEDILSTSSDLSSASSNGAHSDHRASAQETRAKASGRRKQSATRKPKQEKQYSRSRASIRRRNNKDDDDAEEESEEDSESDLEREQEHAVSEHELGLLVAKYLRENGFAQSFLSFSEEYKQAYGPLPEAPRTLKSLRDILDDYLKLVTDKDKAPADHFDGTDIRKLDPLMNQLDSALQKYRSIRGTGFSLESNDSVEGRSQTANVSLSADDISLNGMGFGEGLMYEAAENIAKICNECKNTPLQLSQSSHGQSDAAMTSSSRNAVDRSNRMEDIVKSTTNSVLQNEKVAMPLASYLHKTKSSQGEDDVDDRTKRRRKKPPTKRARSSHSEVISSSKSNNQNGGNDQVMSKDNTVDPESYLKRADVNDILSQLHPK